MKPETYLKLPHSTAAYRCPVNGLSDVYEWKTGKRIPEYMLLDSRLGCKVLPVPGNSPEITVFFGQGGIGRDEYRFWKDKVGYRLIEGEDLSFTDTLKELCHLIDSKIPVILFGLDMYHLPYHQNFYHRIHIPGHINLMVGYDRKAVYLHDNDRDGVQSISYSDLELAWADGYMGFSKRNAYFGIDMTAPNHDVGTILQSAFTETATAFLYPADEFGGHLGYQCLKRLLTEWSGQPYSDKIRDICLHLVTFTSSIIPELPGRLQPYPSGVINPHQASRDTYASALRQYSSEYGTGKWLAAAGCFEQSGVLLERVTDIITDAVLAGSYVSLDDCIPLIDHICRLETEAFSQLI